MRPGILGLFGNTLTGDYMTFPHNRYKFVQQVQVPLSQKPKTLSEFFFVPIIYIKFWHFGEKPQLHSSNISKVIDSQKCGYLNARKLQFHNILRESTCSQIPNTEELCMAGFLS